MKTEDLKLKFFQECSDKGIRKSGAIGQPAITCSAEHMWKWVEDNLLTVHVSKEYSESFVREIFKGIDLDGADSDDSWFPTSTGVEFGKQKLEALLNYLRKVHNACSFEDLDKQYQEHFDDSGQRICICQDGGKPSPLGPDNKRSCMSCGAIWYK